MLLFSLAHIIYLIICVGICVGFYFTLRNKSPKVQYIAIMLPLFLSLLVHFLKILIPEYRMNLPSSLKSITFESICAISTLTFPFIYISKSKPLKNYMVVMGIISGIATLLLPLDVLTLNPIGIETIRFFFAHLIIFMCPLFTYLFKIHKLEGKWIRDTIIITLIVIAIMIINNLGLIYLLDGKQALIDKLIELQNR